MTEDNMQRAESQSISVVDDRPSPSPSPSSLPPTTRVSEDRPANRPPAQKTEMPKPFRDEVRRAIADSINHRRDELDDHSDGSALKALADPAAYYGKDVDLSNAPKPDVVDRPARPQQDNRQADEPKSVKLVIDGQERWVSEREVRELAQKNGAADKRLKEANDAKAQQHRMLEELKQLREQAAQHLYYSQQQQYPAPQGNYEGADEAHDGYYDDDSYGEDDLSDQEIMEAVDKIQVGTAEEAAQAMRQLLGKVASTAQQQYIPQPQGPELNQTNLKLMLRSESDKETANTAFRSFKKDNPDLAGNPAHEAGIWASLGEVMRYELVQLAKNNPTLANLGFTPERIRAYDLPTLGQEHRALRVYGAPLSDPVKLKDTAVGYYRQQIGRPAPGQQQQTRVAAPANSNLTVNRAGGRKDGMMAQPNRSALPNRNPNGTFKQRDNASSVIMKMKGKRPGQGFGRHR